MLSGTPRSGHAALRVQVPRVLQPQPPHPPKTDRMGQLRKARVRRQGELLGRAVGVQT